MKEKKKYRRYSLPVKILILLILIVSTIWTAVMGTWIFIGAYYGMNFREIMHPVAYEDSSAAGVYLFEESSNMLENMAEKHMTQAEPGETGTAVWRIREREDTNILFYVKDLTDDVVYTNIDNLEGTTLYRTVQTYRWQKGENNPDCYYALGSYRNGNADSDPASELSAETIVYLTETLPDDTMEVLQQLTNGRCSDFEMFVGLDTSYPVHSSWSYVCSQLYQSYMEFPLHEWAYAFFPALGIMIWMLVLVGLQAGHNSKDKEIHLKLIDRFPIEIWFVTDIILIVVGLILTVSGLDNAGYLYVYSDMGMDNLLFVSMAPVTGGLLLLSLTAAKMLNLYGRRIKAKTLDGSIFRAIGRGIVKWIRTLYDSRRENQKLIIRYVVILLVNFFLLLIIFALFSSWYPGMGLFFLLILVLADIYMLYRLVKNENGKDEIKAALREISHGNLEYQIDTADMSRQNREMAEEVNRMRDGLRLAVEAQLKSERLKTDLIANVSHDIKTPLTSIINYVDILNREHFEDERIAGYVEILVRKSARLKQLTEDLIEASKISSGNITLNMQDINLKQLIKQTNGEFEEKFEARHLQLVCSLPEEDLMIQADGRRMYRVLENLYNNAAKYAMPYSRVYVDGENRGNTVVFSIKNMSEQPLNISADELMERFVRGDASRTTEGNGLGLEIARNLTVMQHGKFELHLDGDLFKVMILFGEQAGEAPEPAPEEVPVHPEKKTKAKKERKPHSRIRFRKPIVLERQEDLPDEETGAESEK